ncbi:ATP synthase subunit s, mitochondrial-like [Sipha flava]|uniref:ATP synthase subunit s, mitochondrial-like n=1 Tax=Sipha flava TaxID=143950 RepID=A0A8B8G9W8_9HEMI|nr:ATP synthase subunit s, mitochondrial-like [Sipha flava]
MFSKSSLLKLVKNTIGNKRNLWKWVADSFNQFDEERAKEIGPNLACAEWLMKNGAKVRCKGCREFVSHYDCLPTRYDVLGQFKIEQVYAGEEASISHIGFTHFRDCNNILDIAFVRCSTIDNEAIQKLQILKDSLKSLKIDSCENVFNEGIIELEHLQALKYLELKNVQLENEMKIINHLKLKLQNCNIVYNDEK